MGGQHARRREAFLALEAAYMASDARAAAFEGVPEHIAARDIRFVDDEPLVG